MEAIDSFVNRFIAPASIPAGVGTVFLTFFSGKIAPQMPQRFYKLLDNLAIRVIIVAFLINQQIKSPSTSILISVGIVVGFHLFVKVAAPEAPPLSELVHPTNGSGSGTGSGTGTSGKPPCNCNVTVNLKTPQGMTLDTSHSQSVSPYQSI